jgi:Fe2+ or Zn2+ uptake regulation protein
VADQRRCHAFRDRQDLEVIPWSCATGSSSYFDTNVSDHHHFFFEDTGRLLDIPGELAVSGLPKPPAGATIRRIDVVIRVDRNPAPAAD